jgi:hypothetical protein
VLCQTLTQGIVKNEEDFIRADVSIAHFQFSPNSATQIQCNPQNIPTEFVVEFGKISRFWKIEAEGTPLPAIFTIKL